jgi:hypothetical protein
LHTDVLYPQCLNTVTEALLQSCAEGYLDRINNLVNDKQVKKVTDKMPTNFWLLGLIHHLFPEATIIHCIRNPLDTCLSCFFQSFPLSHAYKNDLKTIGLYYKQYEDIMDFWKTTYDLNMMEIHYEDLVENHTERIHTLIEFCGLEWNEACQDYFKSKRLIKTVSYQQVRKPIYTSSVARWKNYEKHISELKELLV